MSNEEYTNFGFEIPFWEDGPYKGKVKWSRQLLIDLYKEYVKQVGDENTRSFDFYYYFSEELGANITNKTVEMYVGSYNGLREACGFEPKKPGAKPRWTKERIRKEIMPKYIKFLEDKRIEDEKPKQADFWNDYVGFHMGTTIRRLFDSWKAFEEEAMDIIINKNL